METKMSRFLFVAACLAVVLIAIAIMSPSVKPYRDAGLAGGREETNIPPETPTVWYEPTPAPPGQDRVPPGQDKKLPPAPAPLGAPGRAVEVVVLVPYGFHNERVGYMPSEGWRQGTASSLWWWARNWTEDLDYYMNYWTVRAFDYNVTVHYSQRTLSQLQNGQQDACGEGADWGMIWNIVRAERPDLEGKQLWVLMLGAGGWAGGGSVLNADGTVN
jgi:hypothetical protein